MIIKVVYLENLKPIYKTIDITRGDPKKIRIKLEVEREKIINMFKQMKGEGLIKNINYPANKKYLREINELVLAKRIINDSLNKLKKVYF